MSDLIERQDILGALKASCLELGGSEWGDGEMGVHKDDIEAVVNSVPSANQWIPCSERLPKYGQLVLTCNLKDDEYEVNHIIDEEDGEWFIHGVDVWMPLPKPYEKRE